MCIRDSDWAGLVDAQWDSRSYIVPPGVKNRIFKNNIFLTWHSLISLFCYYPSLKEDMSLHFNIVWSPLHKDTLCQVWFKLAKWFLRKRVLKVVIVFSVCGYHLPLIKCMALYLNKFEFPLPKNTLCLVWLKLAQRFWRSFSKIVNIFQFLLLSPLLSLIHISEPTRPLYISYAVFCLKKDGALSAFV